MSTNETDPGGQAGEDLKKSPEGYIGNFKQSSPNHFETLLLSIIPRGSRRSELVAFFDNRATWQAIYDWRRGKANPPAWAIEIVRRWYADRAALCSQVRPSPGLGSTVRNLRQYQAKKNTAR